jgi:LmbE family N-acetylglucosaminyl deacetylase
MTIPLAVSDRLLFFAPHPDDESLAAAGLLQRAASVGAHIRLVFATNGDNNLWAQRYAERRWRIDKADRFRWGELRQQEARAAIQAMRLGKQASVRFLSLPDQAIATLLVKVPSRLSAILREEIDQFRPTLIVAPSSLDAHPDHSALSVAVSIALERSIHPSALCYYYVIHRSRRMPCSLVRDLRLSELEQRRKRAAIHCHQSQLRLFPKRFTRFAQPTETYYRAEAAEAVETRDGFKMNLGPFTLDLQIDSSPLLQGAREMLFVFSPYDAEPITWRLNLRRGPFVIEDGGTGAFLRQIKGVKRLDYLQLSLPIFLVPRSPIGYVKVMSRTLFFERFGWFKLALPDRAPTKATTRIREREEVTLSPVQPDPAVTRMFRDHALEPADSSDKSKDRSAPVRWDAWLFRIMMMLFVVSRVALAWYQPINSDEPQHAHVAWAWTQGLVQYRDVFDNHTPLFHLLTAPLAAVIGERSDVLALLRCGIIGFNLLTLYLLWRIAASLFSSQAARLAVAALAFFPPSFLFGGEFRTDALWTTTWIAWIAVATSSKDVRKRCFWGGLILAACFCVSLKSVLLLLTAGAAFGAAQILRSRFGLVPQKVPAITVLQASMLAVAGFSILAGGVLCLFLILGAGPAMYRCVIEHNLTGNGIDLADRIRTGILDPRLLLLVPAIVFVLFWLRKTDSPERRFRIAFVVLWAGFYPLLLRGIWPVVTHQDFLPYYPLLLVCLSPLILSAWKRLPLPLASSPLMRAAGLALLLGVEGGWSTALLLRKRTADPIEAGRIAEVLRLTKPGETVLDPKGDTILRPRPIYEVLELFTMREYREDLLPDRIPEQLIANHTMVVVRSDRYPERTRRFLSENYLGAGQLLVAGTQAHANARGSILFRLHIGGSYVFLTNGRLLSGKLNGVRVSGKVELQPGLYEFVSDTPTWTVTVEWEKAYQIGIRSGSEGNMPWYGTRPVSL